MPHTPTKSKRRFIMNYWHYRCAYCGRMYRKLTLDHIIPKQEGGTNAATNLVPACEKCNTLKGAKSLKTFARGNNISSRTLKKIVEYSTLMLKFPTTYETLRIFYAKDSLITNLGGINGNQSDL